MESYHQGDEMKPLKPRWKTRQTPSGWIASRKARNGRYVDGPEMPTERDAVLAAVDHQRLRIKFRGQVYR